MNKMSFICFRFLSTALLSIGMVSNAVADQPDTEQTPRLCQAGSRSLHSERIEFKERLAAEDAEQKKNEAKSGMSIASGLSVTAKSKGWAGYENYYYVARHPGAIHQPLMIWFGGSLVELEDGSKWTVSSSDSYKTLNWLPTDALIIMPNHEWFSIYDYCIVNMNTGMSVCCNLKEFIHPFYHSFYNYRIVAIDDYMQEILLSDGSVWSIASSDYSRSWQVNDTVIIGINDGWLSSSNPYILINANILSHVRANWIY